MAKQNQAKKVSDLVRKHKEYVNSFKLIDRGNHTRDTSVYRYKWNAKSFISFKEVQRRIAKHLVDTSNKIVQLIEG